MSINKLGKQKNIALIAHDHREKDLAGWASHESVYGGLSVHLASDERGA